MLVDVEDAVDLGDEPVSKAEVSVGRADDRGDSCRDARTTTFNVASHNVAAVQLAAVPESIVFGLLGSR